MKKYYFIVYETKRFGWRRVIGSWVSTGMNTIKSQAITDKHPIQWQLDTNEKYNKEIQDDDYMHREEYFVEFYTEISVDDYNKYEGYVG